MSTIQDSNTNTVDVIQESTSPENMSVQDKLANTGEINTLLIGELTESTDYSLQGTGSVANETVGVVTVIEKNPDMGSLMNTGDEDTNFDRTATPGTVIDDFDSDNESIDRVETIHKEDQEIEDEVADDVNVEDEVQDNIEEFIENYKENIHESEENFDEIEELIDEELSYFEEIEKSEKSENAIKQLSTRGDSENSVSESKNRKSAEFKVIARNDAPKVMLDYEPSTTEAEDSDTLDTESLKEDNYKQKQRKLKKDSSKSTSEKSLTRNESMNSDKEVAVALAAGPISNNAPPHPEYQRGSTDPITQDTMGDQPSLAEDDDGDEVIEVCCENNYFVTFTMDML